MDMNTITQFIQQTGFPIACCVFLFYQNSKMTEVLTENTNAITRLTTLIQERLKVDKNEA